MAALGNYPNHIRLFIFNWPGGNQFYDFFKARSAAENPMTHKALGKFIRALRDAGMFYE